MVILFADDDSYIRSVRFAEEGTKHLVCAKVSITTINIINNNKINLILKY